MDQVAIYDNLLDAKLNGDLQDFFEQVEWRFGSKSTNLALPHWSKYFDMSVINSGCLHDLLQVVKSLVPPNSTLLRCYANAHTPFLEARVHVDDKHEGTYTVIYYPMKAWSVDWGGETVFWDHETKEIVKSIIPKSNRILVFPSHLWHSMRPISRYCPLLRVTLMFKFAPPSMEIKQTA